MAFNVQRMIHDSLMFGVAKTSNFEVEITPPPALSHVMNMTRDLAYRADSVEIPGRNFMTIDQRFSNNGPFNKVPYAQTYPDVTITFILSEDLQEKKYIELWMSKMLNVEPDGGIRAGKAVPTGAFNVKYFDEYKSIVKIKQYDNGGNIQNTVTLWDSYPIIMNGIQMGWGDESIAKLSVQFALRYYSYVDNVPSEDEEKDEAPKFTGQLL